MTNVEMMWDSIRFGETVIVEHDSLTSPALGLYYAIKWAKSRGYRIVIEDILDTLYLHRAHLKLAGLDVSLLDDVPVIKEGGQRNIGRVLKYIQLSKDYVIWFKEYSEIFSSVLEGGKLVNIILGLEKLFLLSSFREAVNIANAILTYTGDERRIALHFLNRDMLNGDKHFVLPLVEEIATTVVRVSKENKGFAMSVVKSINGALDGTTFTVGFNPKDSRRA